MLCSSGLALEYCNEIFNEVNLIDAVVVPARQSIDVVLQFCPLRGDTHQLEKHPHDGKHKLVFFPVRGRIQLTAQTEPTSTRLQPISLIASVCHSVLKTDVHHLLFFKNLAIGGHTQVQVRDFRVRSSMRWWVLSELCGSQVENCSEATLKYVLSERTCTGVDSSLDVGGNMHPTDSGLMSFVDYDTGNTIDTSQVRAQISCCCLV